MTTRLRVERGHNGAGPAVGIDDLPPHSIEAEQATLGAALISRSAAERVLEMLERADYYAEAHRRTYDCIAMLSRRSESVDVLTVPEELRRRGQLESVGGLAYISTLAESVPTAAHVEHYARTVQEKSTLRRLIDASGQIASLARTTADDVESVLEQVRLLTDEVFAHRARRSGLVVYTAPELMAQEYPDPVWVVRGLLPQGVCVLAGPPKARKSFWALGQALAIVTDGMAMGRLGVTRADALCVFLEDRFPEVQERLGQFLGDTEPPPGLHIAQECPRLGDGGEVWLDNWLTAHPSVGLVVLDPLVRIRGGGRVQDQTGTSYDHDYRDMAAFKRLVDRHGVCLLVLHHTRKLPADDWLNTLNSSTGLVGAADAVMLLQGERGADDAVLRATGRKVRDQELALRWGDHTGWTLLGDATHVAYNREQEEVLKAVRESGRPLRLCDLVDLVAEATGAAAGAIKKRVQRMTRRGQLMTEAGLYWATETPAGEGDMCVPVPGVPPVPPCPPVPLSPGTPGTGGTPGTIGTPGTPCSVRGGPLPLGLELPPEIAPEEVELRQRVWRLGWARGWPPVELAHGVIIAAGREAWEGACSSWYAGHLERVVGALGTGP